MRPVIGGNRLVSETSSVADAAIVMVVTGDG